MSTVAFCWRPSSLRIGADTSGAASAAVDLVQQRLEQVMVGPIDDRHLHAGNVQRTRHRQPAESSAEDQDARFFFLQHHRHRPPPFRFSAGSA